jgi:uncharacterized protein YggE
MSLKTICTFAVMAATTTVPSATFAQFGAAGLQATGESAIDRRPEVLRLTMDVFAKGTTVQDALAKLKQRRDSVQKQLEKLGADKAAIKFDDVTIDAAQSDRQQQIEQMMMQRMMQRKGAKKPEKPKAASVRLKSGLTAEWALKGKSADELLIESKGLEDAIKAAELSGVKDIEEPSPEEAELAEEIGDMSMIFSDGNERKPGEPTFIYATKISQEDYNKASSEAYQSARSEALNLSKAAGLELGSLTSLHSQGAPAADGTNEYGGYYNRAFAAMIGKGLASQSSREAVGPTAATLKYKVTVTAVFAIKQP